MRILVYFYGLWIDACHMVYIELNKEALRHRS